MEEIIRKLEEQERKIDAIYASVEKTRSYFKWTFYVTIIVIVLPMIGMIFVLPSFFNNISSSMDILNVK